MRIRHGRGRLWIRGPVPRNGVPFGRRRPRKIEKGVTHDEQPQPPVPPGPHRAVAVYLYLHDRAGKDYTCWPAIATIARDLKYSESTIRRAIGDLRKAGLLETEQRYRDNGGKSSLLFKLQQA